MTAADLGLMRDRLRELLEQKRAATSRRERDRIASQIQACRVVLGFYSGWRSGA